MTGATRALPAFNKIKGGKFFRASHGDSAAAQPLSLTPNYLPPLTGLGCCDVDNRLV